MTGNFLKKVRFIGPTGKVLFAHVHQFNGIYKSAKIQPSDLILKFLVFCPYFSGTLPKIGVPYNPGSLSNPAKYPQSKNLKLKFWTPNPANQVLNLNPESVNLKFQSRIPNSKFKSFKYQTRSHLWRMIRLKNINRFVNLTMTLYFYTES